MWKLKFPFLFGRAVIEATSTSTTGWSYAVISLPACRDFQLDRSISPKMTVGPFVLYLEV